ncbi:hypothetical protein LINPERHAP1_LOCUS37315 [Linum perenne]
MAIGGNNKRTRLSQSDSTSSKKKNKVKSSAAAAIKPPPQQNDGVEVLLRRPKVYITDISSFKQLVQDLTGNGNGNGASNPVVNDTETVVNHTTPYKLSDHHQSYSDVSVETLTSSASVDSFQTSSFGQEEMMMYGDMTASYGGDHYDLAAWDDLEALMQDMDKDQFPMFEESSNLQGGSDLSIYDYDFSGIVC